MQGASRVSAVDHLRSASFVSEVEMATDEVGVP